MSTTPNADYVLTEHGRKVHKRDPNLLLATLCGKAVARRADAKQVKRAPYLLCSYCTQIDGAASS